MTRIITATMLATLIALGAAIAHADDMKPVATCKDGKTYYSENPKEHRGACSGHGGVAKWADGSPVNSHHKKTVVK